MLFEQLKPLRVYPVTWPQLHLLQQAELEVEFITENYVVLHKAFSAACNKPNEKMCKKQLLQTAKNRRQHCKFSRQSMKGRFLRMLPAFLWHSVVYVTGQRTPVIQHSMPPIIITEVILRYHNRDLAYFLLAQEHNSV